MNYKTEITKAMQTLAQDSNVLFVGQTVKYPGSVLSDTLQGIAPEKLIEFPVAEELQCGYSIGLAMQGFLPVSVYPRIDFLLRACDQLSNHLDVLEELTHGEFKAKVIIRTIVGAKTPLYPGIQHSRDLTEAFRGLLKDIIVVKLDSPNVVMPVYEAALKGNRSMLIVEMAELYGKE